MTKHDQKNDITLTEEAITKAIELQKKTVEFQNKDLRLYIEGKGCDGFYYGVSFDECQSEDHQIDLHPSLKLIVDPETLKFCTGSVIEWVDDERGQGFLVENPNHKKFRGKFYKRKNWQERLLEKQT